MSHSYTCKIIRSYDDSLNPIYTDDAEFQSDLISGDYQINHREAWLSMTGGTVGSCNCSCHGCSSGIDVVKASNCIKPKYRLMNAADWKKIIERLFSDTQKADVDHLKLKWAGGEPTKNFRTIMILQPYVRELSRKYEISVDQVIITNGYFPHLPEDAIRNFVENEIRFAPSIWAAGKSNDLVRKYNGSSGITDWTDSMRKILAFPNVKIIFTTVISPDTPNPGEIIRFLFEPNYICTDGTVGIGQYLGSDQREISIGFWRPQDDLGRDEIRTGIDKMIKNIRSTLRELWKLRESGIHVRLNMDYFTSTVRSFTCGATTATYAAIGSFGELSACHQAIGDADMVNARKYENWMSDPTSIFTQAAMQLWEQDSIENLENYILKNLAWNPESDPNYLGFSGKNAGCPMIAKEIGKIQTPSHRLYEELLPDYLSFIYS